MVLLTLNLFTTMHTDTIPVVTLADKIVTGKHIPTYKNRWEMSAIYPDGTVLHRGFWNDEISFENDSSGREVLKRKQLVEYTDRVSIQEEEVYRDNLQHKRLIIYNMGEEPHTNIYYNNNKIWGKKVFRVEGLAEIEQIPMTFSYELPAPVFDWHLWGILISGFPLEVGYCVRFLAHESYSYLPGDFRWYTLNVTGLDTIDAGVWGKTACYIVEVKAEVNWTFWISVDKSIPPVQQIRIDDNDGVQFWWKPEKR
jgi:hypothetical protein